MNILNCYSQNEIYPCAIFTETHVNCLGTKLNIQCDGDKIIKIISATYGRSDNSTCPNDDLSKMENTGCITDVNETLEDYCGGENFCHYRVNNRQFGKECKQSAPYLTFTYACVDRE